MILGARSRRVIARVKGAPHGVTLRLLTAAGTIRTRHCARGALTANERVAMAMKVGFLSTCDDPRIGVRVRDLKNGQILMHKEITDSLKQSGFVWSEQWSCFVRETE